MTMGMVTARALFWSNKPNPANNTVAAGMSVPLIQGGPPGTAGPEEAN
jgi:hypothetical protein